MFALPNSSLSIFGLLDTLNDSFDFKFIVDFDNLKTLHFSNTLHFRTFNSRKSLQLKISLALVGEQPKHRKPTTTKGAAKTLTIFAWPCR